VKQGKPLRRTPLKRTGSLSRSSSLSRGNPLGAGRPKKRPVLDREAAWSWGREDKPPVCEVCGEWCGPIEGHHVLNQQFLRAVATERGLDYEAIRWDKRNRLWVGEMCHKRHHHRTQPIARSVLAVHCPDVFAFAAELGLTSRLERTYPGLVDPDERNQGERAA
jgi:hypothetical protein